MTHNKNAQCASVLDENNVCGLIQYAKVNNIFFLKKIFEAMFQTEIQNTLVFLKQGHNLYPFKSTFAAFAVQ